MGLRKTIANYEIERLKKYPPTVEQFVDIIDKLRDIPEKRRKLRGYIS